MPSLGADMEAGTLVQWLKARGDVLKRGDIIAIVDTEKGAIEIEVFEDGILERVVVEPGQQVPVGSVLAIIKGSAAGPADAGAVAATPVAPAAAPAPAAAAPASTTSRRIRATPAARSLAAERGVNIEAVRGTGPEGAITREDVERACTASVAAPEAPAPSAPARERGGAMRSAIAAAMSRSKREIPHFYLTTTIPMLAAQRWLSERNAARPVAERVLPAALLLKAVALALRAHPQLNGFWIDGGFQPGAGIHVGWATALRGGGLVAPAVHDADGKTLDSVMSELRDLVIRARSNALRSSELSDSTITITSLGDEGVEAVHGIIYPPQVALVGFGSPTLRPALVDGVLQNVPVLTATLSGDHRAIDGRRAALFLAAVQRYLQTPEAL